ncbi:MAG: hypothetical protein AAB177_01090, partial [Nitrospirota bacterium]
PYQDPVFDWRQNLKHSRIPLNFTLLHPSQPIFLSKFSVGVASHRPSGFRSNRAKKKLVRFMTHLFRSTVRVQLQ